MPLIRVRLLAPLATMLALAACGDSAAPVAEDGAGSGEVLPGSISDAMLPIDGTRSEPPLIADAPIATGGAASESVPAEGAEDVGQEEAETVPESAAE